MTTQPIPHGMGEFRLLPKSVIQIDQEYQRLNVSAAKVLSIAQGFNWAAFGVLSVARRPDMTYWAFDGQHRKLAADKRDEVDQLPCMVFPVERKDVEAAMFLLLNGNRTQVRTLEKFRAMVAAHDPDAIGVQHMVETFGYTIRSGNSPRSVCCATQLLVAWRASAELATEIFLLCAKIADGKWFTGDLFSALFYLEQSLADQEGGSVLREPYYTALSAAGPDALAQSMQKARAFRGKSGPKVAAEGLLQFLNCGRRSKRLPEIFMDNDGTS